MKSSTDVAALPWRAPPTAVSPFASPWGRRPAGLWALICESWSESMDIYVRAARYRLPPFL